MKNVLITGVCGGMGYAVAKELIEQGYNVYGMDIADNTDLPIRYFQVDLRERSQIESAFEEISQEIDELYSILHFAGYYTMNSLVEVSAEDFLKIFQINLFSIYDVNKIFFPLLSRRSKIVIASSELAPLDPLPFTGLYAITKSAAEKYAFSLRMEMNLLGISVSVIRPGAVNTGMIGESMRSLEKLCVSTKIYKYNTYRFKKIVNSVETKKIPPQKIAKIAGKVLRSKRPKYVYNVNRNMLLRILSALPQRFQVWIIGKIIKDKKKNK